MLLQVLLLLLSPVIMLLAANLLINATEKICLHLQLSFFGMSALVFGFALSLPRLLHAQMAVAQGDVGKGLGVVVGALVCTLFLNYGMAGLFGRLLILRREIYLQFLFQLGAIFLLGLFFVLGYFQIVAGLILLTFFIFYLFFLPVRDSNKMMLRTKVSPGVWGKFIVGLIGLYAGEEILTLKSMQMGAGPDISSFVLSMMTVGFAITFPQLLVSLMAMAQKKNTDFVIGNIVGANIFTTCLVFGSLCFYNIDFHRAFFVEWIVLLLAAVFLVGLVKMKTNFYKISGIIFLTTYFSLIFYWSAYG